MSWINEVDVEALLAFHSALGAVENVAKSQIADTGKYTYRYADLGDVLDECKRACAMFGLAIFQVPSMDGDRLTVQTVLLHENGGTVAFPPLMMRAPNDAQGVGSALSYSRRYALLTIFGIAPADDDGATATASAKRVDSHQYRTGAEEKFHAALATMSPEQRKLTQDAFRETFGMGLSSMEPSHHGDALTWLYEFLLAAGEAEPEAELELDGGYA